MARDALDDIRRAAGLLIGCEPGRVFLARRSSQVAAPGTWGVPGGCCHVGEDLIAAAVRECREEFGSVPPFRQVRATRWETSDRAFAYTTFVVLVTHEVAAAWRPVMNPEHDQCGWFDLDKLPLPLHDGVRDALLALRAQGRVA